MNNHNKTMSVKDQAHNQVSKHFFHCYEKKIAPVWHYALEDELVIVEIDSHLLVNNFHLFTN